MQQQQQFAIILSAHLRLARVSSPSPRHATSVGMLHAACRTAVCVCVCGVLCAVCRAAAILLAIGGQSCHSTWPHTAAPLCRTL